MTYVCMWTPCIERTVLCLYWQAHSSVNNVWIRSMTSSYLRLVDAAGHLPPWLDSRPRRRRGGRVMQQTLTGCAFCDAPPGTEAGEAHTWGEDERVTHSICVDCAIQTEPDPDERDHYACDGCGLVVDALAASPARCAGC